MRSIMFHEKLINGRKGSASGSCKRSKKHHFLIACSLPFVAAIQQSLHEDYELTQGKQVIN